MTPPLYQLRNAGLHAAGRTILRDLDWSIEDNRLCVIYGAGGAGKTTLLRALAGLRSSSVSALGTWTFRGADLASPQRQTALVPGLVWCPQPPRQWRPSPDNWGPALGAAFERVDSASILLLDEPERWVMPQHRARLLDRLSELRGTIPILLSTHNVAFGQACADEICLLGGGRILHASSAQEFFSSSSPHVRQLLTTGSVWPPATLDPPQSFRWIVAGSVAGMAQPGMIRSMEQDLLFLASIGTSVLITLTETPLPAEHPRAAGIATAIHFPIRDMDVPPIDDALQLARRVATLMDAGEVVLFHCKGGLGRTGLMLALVLMARGSTATSAIEQLRSIQPLYIQNSKQIAFIHAVAPHLECQTIQLHGAVA